MKPRNKFTGRKRNERLWLENDEWCVLAHASGSDVLVRIAAMQGDTPEGDVIYIVEDVLTRQCYPAAASQLRRCKDGAELSRLMGKTG
jgi:hypothetical protein